MEKTWKPTVAGVLNMVGGVIALFTSIILFIWIIVIGGQAPNLIVEGEMQADTALMPEFMAKNFPFSNLKQQANVFIFPDLGSGNIAYKLGQRLGGMRALGPILMGLSKPVHILHPTLDVSEIVDMAAIAVVDAQGS